MITKSVMVELLRDNLLTLEFVKLNGASRLMECTLMTDYIPNSVANNVPYADDNTQSVTVWDIEKCGWRSFYVDRVTSLTIPLVQQPVIYDDQ